VAHLAPEHGCGVAHGIGKGEAAVEVDGLSIHTPDLDDVFLALESGR
jgi:hypothetical protein